jgi:cysteine desulfurase/selenocysteine lyase
MSLYLDNAATSHPKPQAVYKKVRFALEEVGASPGRGAYHRAREASGILTDARKKLATLFDIPDPEQIVFTANATDSINVVLKGWLRPGERVVISSLEHNAVVRPLARLAQTGVMVETIPNSSGGRLDLDHFRHLLIPPPRLVVLVHACNVNGALQPVEEMARLCRSAGVPLFLDAAQTAGVQEIRVNEWDLGMLACSGHKGLLGPSGVGVLYIRPDLDVAPLREGGTGSRSEEEQQPLFRPDRYECGTPNLPGIAGLAAGVDFILKEGVDKIRKHELELATLLEQGLKELPRIRLYRPEVRGTGAVAFNVTDLHPGDVGELLDAGFDIAVRTGLHCAPLAHKTLGSYPAGSVRVSPGYFNTREHIEQFLDAMRSILRHGRRGIVASKANPPFTSRNINATEGEENTP